MEKIFQDFYESSGHKFQDNCFSWLKFLIPDLRNAVDLGEVDRDGVDLYVLKADNSYQTVFQCKGFEKRFDESQIKQCRKSIESFVKRNNYSDEFYLVINHEISSEQAKVLEKELKALVDSGRVKKADYFTAKRFVKYYKKLFENFVLAEIRKSNERFFQSYTTTMDQTFYLEEVPFQIDEQRLSNPLERVLAVCNNGLRQIKKNLSDPNDKQPKGVSSKYLFVISDFGFGKTSLLLQVNNSLFTASFLPVFLPVALFTDNAFENTSSIEKEIFRIVTQTDLDINDKRVKFAAEAMHGLLTTRPEIVLLFDGLDENIMLYRKDGLRVFFNSTRDFLSPSVFSFRKTFWEERFEDFQFALPKTRSVQEKIFLLEWSTAEILVFLKQTANMGGVVTTDLEKSNLARLIKKVEENGYQYLYGDIPKRPLFLEMIVQDVISGNFQERRIAELYLLYFIAKFKRDLNGQISDVIPQRELPDTSIDQTIVSLLDIHEAAALRCLKNTVEDGGSDLVQNIFHEKHIRDLIEKKGFNLDLTKFLNLTVMSPISKRGFLNLKIKFAHYSFLEFFLSRFVVKDFTNLKKEPSPLLSFGFSESTIAFFKSGMSIAIAGETDSKISKLKARANGLSNCPLKTAALHLLSEAS